MKTISIKKIQSKNTKKKHYLLLGGNQYCSPKNSNDSGSCLSYRSLQKIANSINNSNRIKTNSKKKIRSSNRIRIKTNSKKKILWNSIKNHFQDKCKNEWCWIQQETVKKLNDSNIINSFRPEMPSSWLTNNREWLSTLDIENVMEQYQERYNNFLFIGPVPIDFDSNHHIGGCIVDELCKLNVAELYKANITKLGIIFNLDKHNEPGSHWVALFSNFKDKSIYYYDSYATAPNKEIRILMDRIDSQLTNIHPKKKSKIDYNHIRHQYKNSECGVYSMMFIINMLENNNFTKTTNNIVLDDEMNQNRNTLYSPSNSL